MEDLIKMKIEPFETLTDLRSQWEKFDLKPEFVYMTIEQQKQLKNLFTPWQKDFFDVPVITI